MTAEEANVKKKCYDIKLVLRHFFAHFNHEKKLFKLLNINKNVKTKIA